MDNKRLDSLKKILLNTHKELLSAHDLRNVSIEFRRDTEAVVRSIDELLDTMEKLPLTASLENPTDDGVAFDTLIDGEEDEEEPVVQELTRNDGGFEEPREQELLIDDLPQ